MATDLFERILAALREPEPARKAAQAGALHQAWCSGELAAQDGGAPESLPTPGLPERPLLVAPQEVPRRNPRSRAGHAALLHALAHIEFNAINLALDAAYRFRDLPHAYYGDWLQVAAEEASHYSLLRAHLQSLGYDYGDFPAHDGLWEMAVKTAHDALVRMALVPRVLEARGLDATPAIRAKLLDIGDAQATAILDVIERDEVGHVAIGNRWYFHLCAARGLEPLETFRQLIKQYDAPPLKPPFNWAARSRAGFRAEELAWLHALEAARQPQRPR